MNIHDRGRLFHEYKNMQKYKSYAIFMIIFVFVALCITCKKIQFTSLVIH